MLIGITGNIGCGKDTVAKMIQYYFWNKKLSSLYMPCCNINRFLEHHNEFNTQKDVLNWQIRKFAFKLKQIAAILVGCNAEDFESEEFKNKYLPHQWMKSKFIDDNTIKVEGKTYRWLLQQLGTEAIRNNIHSNSWINALFSDYKKERTNKYHRLEYLDMETEINWDEEYPNWIISDIRFLNEAKSIKDRNGIIVKVVRTINKKENSHSSETELSSIHCDCVIYNETTIEELYSNVCGFLKDFGY